MLAIRQTMLLIIHLWHWTALTPAAGPGEAIQPPGVNPQKVTSKPKTQTCPYAIP